MSQHSRLRDNDRYGSVAAFLQEKIQDGSSLSVVSAYFTIYAFNALKDTLTDIKDLRFLFGEPSFIHGIDPEKTESKAFQLTEEGLALGNYFPQKEIAKACAAWIAEKVTIRSVRKSNFLHGKMYYIEKDGGEDAIIGSSNFTVRGLGLSEKASNIELNLEVDSKSDCADLKVWFDSLWESDEVTMDVTQAVLRQLENAYQEKSPEFIYYKTLYHLFEEFLGDATDAAFAEANPRFQETEIWQTLYAFQKHGVQAVIQKLKAYNGCIIADSVGLGKTYEALAVIKYYELRNAKVLVLCPKKLESNWTLYPVHHGRPLNPFKTDRFRYNVLAHTDLSRDSGETNGIDLADHEWDGYDLVVIDESHNFRNRAANKLDQDGGILRKSRYNKLLADIIQSGCNTQVLMLSATPVNNHLTDLENQFRFITGDRDAAFEESGIPSIRGTLTAAQSRFETWTAAAEKGGVQGGLAEDLNADFFALLDRLTIARSRTHITKFYGDFLQETDNKFPDREPPESIFSEIDTDGTFPSYEKITAQIETYQLALFNPSRYIRDACRHHYGEKLLRQRETNLIGMMRVNFLKRLESSVHSFAKTLARTITNIDEQVSAIQAFLDAGTVRVNEDGFTPFAEATEAYGEDAELQTAVEAGADQTYRYEHLDLRMWLADLQEDRARLKRLCADADAIKPARDAKLARLKALIAQKAQHPTRNRDGKENRKVLVFTAFADTANYLYENLQAWAAETLDMESAVVTGGESRSRAVRNNFDDILAHFSPIAKGMADTDAAREIDLLIATDCISEGQNLQDGDYVVNYDIHWNPVRIIQRFGRVDRIGSRNKKVSLVNFWPTPELDEYINLKPRVEARMALVNLTATGDDDLLSLKGQRIMEQVWTHRDEQLRRMKTEILDFEDIEEQFNLNQFTLDDFRAQLLNYLRENEAQLRDAPLGLYAVTGPATHANVPVDIEPGVIFCLKQVVAEGDMDEGKKLNPVHPYCLVYVSDAGKVSIGFTNPNRMLEHFSALCVGKSAPDPIRCNLFNEETENGADMTLYEMLIDAALKSIRETYSRKVADHLDASADALLPMANTQITTETEFELITWLVISEDPAPSL